MFHQIFSWQTRPNMISGGFNISIFGLSPKPAFDRKHSICTTGVWEKNVPNCASLTVVHPNVTLLLSRFFILCLSIFVYLFFSSILGTQTHTLLTCTLTSLTSCTTYCGHDAYVFVFIIICLLMSCRLLLTIAAGRRQSSILNPN